MAFHGLIVKKIGMTRMLDPEGNLIAVTLLQVDNQKITKVLTKEKNGYDSYQIGFYEKPEFRLRKPDLHRLRKAKVNENFSRFREVRLDQADEIIQVGVKFEVAALEGVSNVDVTGITKGRGFQGAIKRWHAKMGRETHGSMYHRRTGSIGSNTSPARVWKNKHMPGHMGSAKRTMQNLKIVDLDKENNVIAIKGSVPGHRNGYLLVKPSVKTK